jgi:hypothetical protein
VGEEGWEKGNQRTGEALDSAFVLLLVLRKTTERQMRTHISRTTNPIRRAVFFLTEIKNKLEVVKRETQKYITT